MVGTHDLALFALTVLVVNATPGVDMMFTLTRTLQHGVRAGLVAALGISAGCLLHTAVAALGLAALLAASAAAFNIVKWLGAAYLAWLAFGMLRQATRPSVEASPAPPRGALVSLRRTFGQALLTNALNPKVAIFFLALLPQFIDAAAPDKTLAFAFLGLWVFAQSLLFLVVFALLVAPLRRWQPAMRWRRALQATSGLLFAGLAARLAWAGRS